jgi:hypothetical protein
MDLPDMTPSTQPQADSGSLQQQVDLLRNYLVVALVATVVVAFCFNVFLYRLDKNTRGQIAQTTEVVRARGPVLSSFLNQVVTFSSTHPEVAQILVKYGLKLTNAPAATPAPAAVPARPAPAPTGTAPKK